MAAAVFGAIVGAPAASSTGHGSDKLDVAREGVSSLNAGHGSDERIFERTCVEVMLALVEPA